MNATNDSPQTAADWSAEFSRLVRAATLPLDAFYRLPAPPNGVESSEESLRTLAGVWLKHIGERTRDEFAEYIVGFLGPTHRGEVQRAVLPVVARLEHRIDELLAGCGRDFPNVGVIPSAVFTRARMFGTSGRDGRPIRLFVACLADLPNQHWLQSMVPAADRYNGDAMFLGPVTENLRGEPIPRKFYELASAVRVTRAFAQRDREEHERAIRELDHRDATARTISPVALRMEELEREVAELKSAVAKSGNG